MKKIGFIGYGLRSETMMKAFTRRGPSSRAGPLSRTRAWKRCSRSWPVTAALQTPAITRTRRRCWTVRRWTPCSSAPGAACTPGTPPL